MHDTYFKDCDNFISDGISGSRYTCSYITYWKLKRPFNDGTYCRDFDKAVD